MFSRPEIHVYELSSQIEIALKIRCIYDIYYDIGCFTDEIVPYEQFLGAVGREGICARKVHQNYLVVFVVEYAFLGIDGHAAVVAYMLVPARGGIEKSGLAAVRVTHEGDTDFAAALLGQAHHLGFNPFGLHNRRNSLGEGFSGLFFAHNLNHPRRSESL